jgi:hypothetical protein
LEQATRDGLKVHYIPAIKEMYAMQYEDTKSGHARIKAAEGSHDDLVMAACKANFGFLNYKYPNQGIKVSYPSTWRG